MAKNEKPVTEPAPSPPAAPSTIRLRNRTRGQLVFNLPHEEYCSAEKCSCSSISKLIEDFDYRTKEHVAKVVDHRICSSIGWLAGETLECNPRVLQVQAIAAAIRRSELAKV